MVHVIDATVIADDTEALDAAKKLAEVFAARAAERDAQRRLPLSELDELSASGLLGITVPAEYGGAEVSTATLVEVIRRLATADPNIAQIPQSHFGYVNVLAENASAAQQEFFYGEILAGKRLGNAQAEAGTRTAQDIVTRLTAASDGYVLSGSKKYSTGALLAHWIPVLVKDTQDRQVVAYVRGDDPGVQIIDDWDGMGQRTTASGSVRFTNVSVPADRVVEHHRTFERPQLHGALTQIIHAAIDAGIARAAVTDAAEFVRTRSRPWKEADVASAADDPLTLQQFGELEVQVRGTESLLVTAGNAIDGARPRLTEESAATASVAVATAKVAAARAAVDASNALFELAGTSAAREPHNLHRHWRNARTHTLHDPVRWKVQHIGRHALNGTPPPRTGHI